MVAPLREGSSRRFLVIDVLCDGSAHDATIALQQRVLPAIALCAVAKRFQQSSCQEDRCKIEQ